VTYSLRIWSAITVVLIASYAEPKAAGFDDLRPGIVFGGDIGFSPATIKHYPNKTEYVSGTCLSGFAGWGVKENLNITLHGYALFYDATTSSLTSQGFLGLSGHYLLKPQEFSPFIVVGAGMYLFHQARTLNTEVGPGFLFSVGQEMNRRVRISVSVAGGKTEDITHLQASANVGIIFY
jgi:hypothetical protein